MFSILVSDHLHPSGWEYLRQAEDVTCIGPYESREEVIAGIGKADAIIIRSATKVDADLLSAAPDLKVIARAGSRIDNIDMDTATRCGIIVINVPDANVLAAVEHTFGMIFALTRELPRGYNAVRAGEWPRHDMLGLLLYGKTIGVIGFGRLGREFAVRARAFGLHILAYDPYVDLSIARDHRVEIVDLGELLERADIVTLLTTPTSDTYHIMNRDTFGRMKAGAFLVNCAHAGLVDEGALLEALDSGSLAGAALDTIAEEPPHPGHPLIHHSKVIITPHLNQNTFESQETTATQVVADVLDALRGNDFRNVVNLPFTVSNPYREIKSYVHLAEKMGRLQGQLSEGQINRLEVEVLGERRHELVRPVTAALLSGMLNSEEGGFVNWVSAPVLANEQGVSTTQAKQLLDLPDYPNLVICRSHWENHGSRIVAGALFANDEARIVHYDGFSVDAIPTGYVLILENQDVPGVIGKVGTQLGNAGVNIANWRYGRETIGGNALSFVTLDTPPPKSLLAELENHPEIHCARLVHL